MVEVRCPECGYLQALSEERFVAAAADALTCPHCGAAIPVDRPAARAEPPPEEAARKIHAFSRRLIEGNEVTKEMAMALEGMVRYYGHAGESAKALGIGFGRLGDFEKAESYLNEARGQAPDDPDTNRAFFLLRLSQGDWDQAVVEGFNLLNVPGRTPFAQDVEDLATALQKIGRNQEAEALLKGRPDLERKRLDGGKTRKETSSSLLESLLRFLKKGAPLRRLFQRGPSRGKPQGEIRAATKQAAAPGDIGAKTKPSPTAKPPVTPNSSRALVEYWIYSKAWEIPREEQIRERLGALFQKSEDRRTAVDLFDAGLKDGRLVIASYAKSESPSLFEYPEDMLPKNSRLFGDEDTETLRSANVIGVVRFQPGILTGLEYLLLAVCVVEALRGLIGGVIQDAVSHVLWNGKEWRARVVEAPSDSPVEPHVRFEVLDEGKNLWVHSHGMQKFGLPELEIDKVPPDAASPCVTFMVMAAEAILKSRLRGTSEIHGRMAVENTPFLFCAESVAPDEERHFPLGSLRIIPYLADYDPQSEDTLRHVLKICTSKFLRQSRGGSPRGKAPAAQPVNPSQMAERAKSPRELMLEAYKRARVELPEFKKSFQSRRPESSSEIYAVKVGFPVHSGEYEWMWVSLEVWRGDSLVGHVENAPVLRTDLRKGSRVQINEAEIFDWVIITNGARVKGAYTEEVSQVPEKTAPAGSTQESLPAVPAPS